MCLGVCGLMPLSLVEEFCIFKTVTEIESGSYSFEDKAASGIERGMFSLAQRFSEQPLELELRRGFFCLFALLFD